MAARASGHWAPGHACSSAGGRRPARRSSLTTLPRREAPWISTGCTSRRGDTDDGAKSIAGGFLSLARRSVVGELLRSLQAHPAVVLGNLLDHGRPVLLGVRTVADCGPADARSAACSRGYLRAHAVLVLAVGRHVGIWRAHVRPDHA